MLNNENPQSFPGISKLYSVDINRDNGLQFSKKQRQKMDDMIHSKTFS